jgi:hypothetical protein
MYAYKVVVESKPSFNIRTLGVTRLLLFVIENNKTANNIIAGIFLPFIFFFDLKSKRSKIKEE